MDIKVGFNLLQFGFGRQSGKAVGIIYQLQGLQIDFSLEWDVCFLNQIVMRKLRLVYRKNGASL
jgi:hypothetical protein